MKLHRKILFAAFSLLLALGLFSLAACGKEDEKTPEPITYTVTVTCEDESVLAGVQVALQTPAGEPVEGGEAKGLTAGMVSFSLLPATYKTVLTGVPETYLWQAATLTEASPAATVSLTKKDAGTTEPDTPDKPDKPDEPEKPTLTTYTVYLNLSASDEAAFADVKVALQTPAGEAVEGGEAKATAEDADFYVFASFEVAPGTYKVVLLNVPENYSWEEVTLTEEAPTATISFTHLADYTVTVSCEDEAALANVKVSLQNTLDSSVPAGGEERALSGGTATFRVKAGTYSVNLTGVPDTYSWQRLLVSDTSPSVTVTLTLKETDPPATEDHLPTALNGAWESAIPSMQRVVIEGDVVTVEGELGTGSASATEITHGSTWNFKAQITIDAYTMQASFTYDETADSLFGTNSPSRLPVAFTRVREAEVVEALPAALAGTMWTPDHAIAGVSEVSFTTESVFIGDGFFKPASITLLDGVYTFPVTFTVSGTVTNTLTFTYNAAAGTLTAVNGYDSATLNFTKTEAVDPNAFGTVAASIPDETVAELAKAAWTSDDEIVAQVTFEKIAATYGIKVYIYMKNGRGGPVSVLIENGEIRKDGTVYQIAYIPKSGTNIRYTVLLRYDTAAKTLTALYGSNTVTLTQETVQENPSVYPAELEGTTWLNAEDPDGTLSGIRSITFINGEIRWVDANGNTQRVNSASAENGMILAIVDYTALPQGYFSIEYSGGSMTVHTANLGSTSGFTFTKQA